MATASDLRAAAMALPEAVEMPHFGAPSFRVRGRIFAQVAVKDWEAGGALRAILKMPEDRRLLLCEVEPDVFSPCNWGATRFLFVALDGVDAGRLAALVGESWRMVAPKRLMR